MWHLNYIYNYNRLSNRLYGWKIKNAGLLSKVYINYYNGKKHNLNGPACYVKFTITNRIELIQWIINDAKHSINDLPAVIRYNPFNGEPQELEWYSNNKLHRKGDIARKFYLERTLNIAEYYHDGALHRDDGPSSIFYTADGTVENEYWYKHGQIINLDNFNIWFGIFITLAIIAICIIIILLVL